MLKEMEESKKKNSEDRIKYIDFCSEQIKTNPKNYFKAHKQFIDSMY